MSPPTNTSVMLVTGEYFDYLAQDPSVINLDVLEHGLDVPRFNNQTLRPITVLEHSLRVKRIARELGGDDEVQLWALLHDGHEAVLPWGDCLRPGKTEEMRSVEGAVDHRIAQAVCGWAIAPHGHEHGEIVKTADAIALYFEALWWQPGARDWVPGIMHLIWSNKVDEVGNSGLTKSSLIERFMPLIAPRPGECWRAEVESLLGARS